MTLVRCRRTSHVDSVALMKVPRPAKVIRSKMRLYSNQRPISLRLLRRGLNNGGFKLTN